MVPLAGATGTTINASVCGQLPGALRITAPGEGALVNKASVQIEGSVSRLTQIRAYVNDVYQATVPLDASSTSFSYALSVSAGQNTVKLVGVDPCNANGPEDTVTLSFDPGAPSSPISQVVDTTTNTATDTVEFMTDQVAQAAQTAPAAGLSAAAYSVMQSLDIAPLGGTPEEMQRMTQRFTAVTAGTALMIFAHPMFAAYHVVRYQFMQWNIHAFPALVRRHSLFVLRLVGAGMFISAFLF